MESNTICDGVNQVGQDYYLYDPETCSEWCYNDVGAFMS